MFEHIEITTIFLVILGLLAILGYDIMFTAPPEDICENTCVELDKEYFKYNYGGFGSGSCWCKVGENDVIRIY